MTAKSTATTATSIASLNSADVDSPNNDTKGSFETYSYSPKALLASWNSFVAKNTPLEKKEVSTILLEEAAPVDEDDDLTSPKAAALSSSLSSTFKVAVVQLTGAGLPDSDIQGFVARAEDAVERAVETVQADLILLPELFSGPYFCQTQEYSLMALASPAANHILLQRFQKLAARHHVVLPLSIYERYNNVLYNSIVMIDADGSIRGNTYRKSHIPDGPGYCEKFYFSPGDSGLQVYDTAVGKVGIAICWDQWFPEVARCLALQGADVLLYPTAIGSEPHKPAVTSAAHWQRVMQGHAAANMIPVVAANRYGTEILLHDEVKDTPVSGDQDEGGAEDDEDVEKGSSNILLTNKNNNQSNGQSDTGSRKRQHIHFYGKSFITDNKGEILQECTNNDILGYMEPAIIAAATIDKEQNQLERIQWGLFRDRRPELYRTILKKNGNTKI